MGALAPGKMNKSGFDGRIVRSIGNDLEHDCFVPVIGAGGPVIDMDSGCVVGIQKQETRDASSVLPLVGSEFEREIGMQFI